MAIKFADDDDDLRHLVVPLDDDALSNLSKQEARDLLHTFVQSGRIKKEVSSRLYDFCCAEQGEWISDDNGNNNAAAPPTCTPTGSQDLSLPAMPQQYGLSPHQLSQNDADYTELRPFLLQVAAPFSRLTKEQINMLQNLYNRSSLPGHGTEQGFNQLVDEAASVSGPIFNITRQQQHRASPSQGMASSPVQQQHRSFYDSSVGPAHVPKFTAPSRRPGAQMQPHAMATNHTQPRNSDQQFTAQQFTPSPARSLADIGSPPVLNLALCPPHQANDTILPAAKSMPDKTRKLSRQKTSGHTRVTQTLIGPPKKATSKNEKGMKVSKEVVVHCKLVNKNGKQCSKACSSEDIKNAEGNACKFLIEHVHRVHPEHCIANLPSSRESLNDMLNVQIAECTIKLANGQPCLARFVSLDPWREAIDHIQQRHPESYNPLLKAPRQKNFETMVNDYPILCCPLLSTKFPGSGQACDKYCHGPKVYRSFVEHLKRGHCAPVNPPEKNGPGQETQEVWDAQVIWKTYYVGVIKKEHPHLVNQPDGGLKCNEETTRLVLDIYYQRMGPNNAIAIHQAPAMEPSASKNSMASTLSSQSSPPQHHMALQDAPTHTSPRAQHVQQFRPASQRYDSNEPQCLPPCVLQNQTDQDQVFTRGFPHPEGSLQQQENLLMWSNLGPRPGLSKHSQQMPQTVFKHASAPEKTLGRPLFPQDDQTADIGPAAMQRLQSNGHQQHQRDQLSGQGSQVMRPNDHQFSMTGTSSSDSFSMKREREEVDGDEPDSRDSPSKRACVDSRRAFPSHFPIFAPPVHTIHPVTLQQEQPTIYDAFGIPYTSPTTNFYEADPEADIFTLLDDVPGF